VAVEVWMRPAKGEVASHFGHDFARAAQVTLGRVEDVELEVQPRRVAFVHPQQVHHEQPRLGAARSGAQFQNHVLAVVGVGGKQQHFEFGFDFGQSRL